jgi:hypothetical protein
MSEVSAYLNAGFCNNCEKWKAIIRIRRFDHKIQLCKDCFTKVLKELVKNEKPGLYSELYAFFKTIYETIRGSKNE